MENSGNVVLIGMPASGKSTVGVLLAKRAGLDFVDTDILIQKGEGKRLETILSESGMEGFLEIEEAYLLASSFENHVIATGGSVVYSEKAMNESLRPGIFVYLEQSISRLEKRISSLDTRGVVKMPGQSFKSLYHQRIPLYEMYADITISCRDFPPDRIVSEIMHRLST